MQWEFTNPKRNKCKMMENKEILVNDVYLVLSMMVLIRWAMVRIVQSAKLSLIVSWMSASVSKSIAAVASSNTSTLVFRSKARAKQMSCRWPTLYRVNDVALHTLQSWNANLHSTNWSIIKLTAKMRLDCRNCTSSFLHPPPPYAPIRRGERSRSASNESSPAHATLHPRCTAQTGPNSCATIHWIKPAPIKCNRNIKQINSTHEIKANNKI